MSSRWSALTATDSLADQFQWLLFNESTQQFDPLTGENQPTYTATQSGLYQVLTLNGTEVSTEEFEVTLIPEPVNNLPAQITACSNETVTLDASVQNINDYDSFEYQWLLNNNPISGETQATLDLNQTGNYSVEITTTNLNVDTDGNDINCVNVFDIQVNSADFTVDLGGDQTFCDAGTQTITAIVNGVDSTNATYLWNTGETTSSIDVDTTGTYEVTVTIDGCPVTESVEYTFAEDPQFDLGSDLNLCEGETLSLDASIANSSDFTSVSYQWFDNNGIIAGETQSTLVISTQGTFNVEVTTTTTTLGGATFDYATTDSIVVNGAVFSVDLGGDQTFCDAGTQTITAIVNGVDSTNATYLWITGETTSSIDVDTTGTYEVTVTIDGCPVTESVEYTFNESPIIALGPDTATCDLGEIVLNATPSNANGQPVNYLWSLDGNPLNQNTAIINPTEFGLYEVEVYFDDPDCSFIDNINLSERDISVDINSNDDDNLFCIDETVTFSASLQNAELIEADFQWFVNNEPKGDNSPTLEYTVENAGAIQEVKVVVSIGSDCDSFENELTFNLYDIDNCVIPQGISPGNDGFNDKLDLNFLADRSGISKLEIFNRYGKRVYEKSNYKDEFMGQSDNGNRLKTGTIFMLSHYKMKTQVLADFKKVGYILTMNNKTKNKIMNIN
ncbi:gliding motility-associated C-terminal domain-containing protein [Flavobacterium sp. CS20]|uniref:T9SS type B sorting domain-containing protein n=1 Tax=Flavobacterium sp. CS20 TaxID=2775246 RepID=UPI001B39E1BE|nr:gliding motility-associated C-terminal domain-containing protein [Flavobacterium sp. CS20]QTY26293.1 gliding motility-associated C-terminal domain-containing protein [Flavobacterium sp. CS20]